MTSHLKIMYLLILLTIFGLNGCSNSLTTRGEPQTVQSIDEAFPSVDEEFAQTDTEDLSDEDLENFDEGSSAQNLEDDFSDFDTTVANNDSSADLEDFNEDELEDNFDTPATQSSLDLSDDDLSFDEEPKDNTTNQAATNTEEDPFADFEDSAAESKPTTENFVTQDSVATEDPFADFLSEDLDAANTTLSDDTLELDSDLNSTDTALADPPMKDPAPTENQQVFENQLDNDFADVMDSPINDNLLDYQDSSETNKLTVLEYNAQNENGVIVLKAEKPLEFSTQYDAVSSQFILNLQNVTVPSILQRPLYLKDFKQSFGAIKATPVSGGLVQVIVKVNNNQEPNILSNGREILISPGKENLVGKVAKVSESTQLNPDLNIDNQISRNLNLPMNTAADSDKALNASSLEEFLLETGTFYGDPINLQVNEEEIGTVIGFIADYSGANIVISPGVTGKISIKLRNVPWDQALLTIMKTKGLGYVRTGNILRISPLEDLQKEALAAVEVRKSQIQIEPTLLKIIPLQYASSTEILTQVTPFLTKDRGTATEDKRTSSIVLNDTQAVIAKVSRLIKELDLPPPQVLIEAKIVEATKVFASSIGVRWGASGSTAQISPTGGFQGGPISITPRLNINGTQDAAGLVSSQPLSGSISFGVLDFFGNIDAAIGLSESDDQIRVISSPRVTTLNNVEATITQSSEIIRIQNVVTNGISTTTPIAVPVQLQLKVTPQITSGSSILMQLDVKNEFSGTPVGGQAPKNSRNAIAKVLVENNKTAVIGGIYDKSSVVSDVGVPFLKNIPLIGWLFKTKTTQKRDTEVMMFITPRILDKNYQTTTSANSL
jgi:type IV pilus assembly protein PilQ